MARYYINGKQISKQEANQINKDNEKYIDLAHKDLKNWDKYMSRCKFIFCVYSDNIKDVKK